MPRPIARPAGLVIKRLLDVVLASCGLIALSPLIFILSVAIRVSMGSPVLFRQRRPGRDGRQFTMLKFRSMSHPSAIERELDHDSLRRVTQQRVTRVGYWIRKTSLDEVPELWNVLRGEMSLVGPRPLLTEYLPYYTPEQMRRHDMRPGLTGLAQVRGRHNLDWDTRFWLDTWYVDHWSVRLDARIMKETVKVLVSGQGDFMASSEPARFDTVAIKPLTKSADAEDSNAGMTTPAEAMPPNGARP